MMFALLGMGALAQASVPPPPPPPPASCDPFMIFFDSGSAKVPPRYVQMIDNMFYAWKQGKPNSLHVMGFTDSAGSEAYNLRLSRLRAEAVKAALVAKGVPNGVIVTDGVGETSPLIEGPDGTPEPQNRLVSVCFY